MTDTAITTGPGPGDGAAPLLVASDIRRTFRLPRRSLLAPRAERHALRGVDLELAERGSLGIVGESGSGKTTLVRALLALDPGAES